MMKNTTPTMLGAGMTFIFWSATSYSQEAETEPVEARTEEAVSAEAIEEAPIEEDLAEDPEVVEPEPDPASAPEAAAPESDPASAPDAAALESDPASAPEAAALESEEELAPEMEETPSTEQIQPVEEVEEEVELEDEPFAPSFTVGAGLRTGLEFGLSGPNEGQLSLNDGLVDQVHIRPYMSGSLVENVGFFVQFEIGTPNGLGSFAILDGIAQIKFIDELQLWVGQHISANDRNSMNGPFFGNTWNFAIAVEEYPFDVGARDRGATLWGLIAGGHLKYHLSLVDLQPGRDIGEARGAGRLTVHFWEPENFYYNSGSYWGTKDILTLGGVFQGQAGEEGQDNGLIGFSLDGMMEKNMGKAGTLTLEAGYWNYENTGAGYVVNQGTVDEGMGIAGPYPGSAYMGLVSWLTPGKLGPGQIQPNFRVQYADWDVEKRLVFDGGLAYVIDGFNHKYHVNYRHYETDPTGDDKITGDSIQFGVQYQMGL